MGRPKNTIPCIEKNISIPAPLAARVDLVLFSELEGRVPHGAWSRYVSQLILSDLIKKKEAKNA